MAVGARRNFQFFRKIIWFHRNQIPLFRFKHWILHHLISIIKLWIDYSVNLNFILIMWATLTDLILKSFELTSLNKFLSTVEMIKREMIASDMTRRNGKGIYKTNINPKLNILLSENIKLKRLIPFQNISIHNIIIIFRLIKFQISSKYILTFAFRWRCFRWHCFRLFSWCYPSWGLFISIAHIEKIDTLLHNGFLMHTY